MASQLSFADVETAYPSQDSNTVESELNRTEFVAFTRTRGGVCAHCRKRLSAGTDIFKWAPGCCDDHTLGPATTGEGQGRGSWVCAACHSDLEGGGVA